MKLIFSFLTLVFPLSVFAAHPWTDIPGCFKTLTHNGKAVNTNGAQSSIRDVDDLAVIRDIKGQPLGGLEIMIVQGYDSAADEMKIDYQAVLTDRGEYTSTPDGTRSFAFDGFIRFQDMPPLRVKQNASVKWSSPTQLLLKTKRVVVGTGGAYDTDDAYMLEKATCNQ
jgi:hypothetical protein